MQERITSVESQEFWKEFARHFKNEITADAYLSEIEAFERICGIDILNMGSSDAEFYYLHLLKKEEAGNISWSTLTKKLWELHSFSAFVCERKEDHVIPEDFEDYFFSWLKKVKPQENVVHSVPVEHIDALYRVTEGDIKAYTIISLLHRAGLSSTEIVSLRMKDIAVYENGTFAYVEKREDVCYIPEDACVILERFLQQRNGQEVESSEGYLFCNKNGNPLNKMYISRMLKKYAQKADIPAYSAEKIRTTCGATLFAYGAKPGQVAKQMGITLMQIHKYKKRSYRDNLIIKANNLVKIKIDPPKFTT